jgi:hypothetical protein
MPVIINQLEVIAPPPVSNPASKPPQTRPQPGPTPHDIQRVLRQATLRALRVKAD